MKVLAKVPLSTYAGYGKDGLGIVKSLVRQGLDVYLQPAVIPQAPMPAFIGQLYEKPLNAPFDLAIHHVDPANLECSDELARSSEFNIAWTMWEFSDLGNLQPFAETDQVIGDRLELHDKIMREHHVPSPLTADERQEMFAKARRGEEKDFRKKIKNFNAIVVYDAVAAECFKPYYNGPIVIQQGGFEPEGWKPLERDWDIPEFRFCQIGVLSERKNPFASIRAFGELKNEDADFNKWARLSLKTTAPGLHSKMEDVYSGLRIFYDMWPTEVVKEFYSANHVLLAPSRGEGKNLPALEFMSTGGAVIATNWGGHTQWLNPDYSYAVDYELQPIDSQHPTTMQAEIDNEHLKAQMLHCFRNRNEVKEKGELAAQIIPQMCNWDSVFDRLFDKLRVLPGGERLFIKREMT